MRMTEAAAAASARTDPEARRILLGWERAACVEMVLD